MRLRNPWPDGYKVNPNGKYGMRRHPKTGKLAMHRGVDVAGVYPVTAAGPGVVVRVAPEWRTLSKLAQLRQGGGNVVIIDHGEIHTVYYHGAHRSQLREGQRVEAGQFIYTSGTTGVSTGNHLHFEVRKTRNPNTHTDPMPYLQGRPPQPMLTVDGRPGRETWRAFQNFLLTSGHNPGRIDGLPGPMTFRALQAWLGVPQTGALDVVTRRALQTRLGVKVDGVLGRLTWSEIQRQLNAGTL
jgi:hypothetical protein